MKSRKIQAAVLAAALLLPAATAMGNDWTKRESRTRGATIGGAIGVLAGPPGVVAGAAIGNGVQYLRHASHHRHSMKRHYHYR